MRQVSGRWFHRLADCWRDWGSSYGYFKSESDGNNFYDKVLSSGQFAAPNSPQWFNTGLFNTYGIKGSAQGHFYVDAEDGEAKKSSSGALLNVLSRMRVLFYQ